MNVGPEEKDFLRSAWRLALVLTGRREGAAKVFQDSVDEILRHPQAEDEQRAKNLLFATVRRRSLRFPARCELTGSVAQLHRQLEPGRSALVLTGLEDAISADSLPHLLEIDKKSLDASVAQARAAFPPGASEILAGELNSLPLDARAEEQIEDAAKELSAQHDEGRLSVRNPATLAVGFGFLLLVAVLVWYFLGQAGVFPDEAIKIATEGMQASPEQFEPVEERAGALQDWFMLKGNDIFRVPMQFENFTVAGVRSFKVENELIAQAAVPENAMYFFSFASQPFGITVAPEKSWRITEAGRSVLAIREENGVCFMIGFRGAKSDMVRVLREAGINL